MVAALPMVEMVPDAHPVPRTNKANRLQGDLLTEGDPGGAEEATHLHLMTTGGIVSRRVTRMPAARIFSSANAMAVL